MFINFRVVLAERRERQVDLAAKVGISDGNLSLIISGRRQATPELRARLAAALEVSEKWLFAKNALKVPASARRPASSTEAVE